MTPHGRCAFPSFCDMNVMHLLLLADVTEDGHEDFEVILWIVGFRRLLFVPRHDNLDVFFVLSFDALYEDSYRFLRFQTLDFPT